MTWQTQREKMSVLKEPPIKFYDLTVVKSPDLTVVLSRFNDCSLRTKIRKLFTKLSLRVFNIEPPLNP